MPRTRSYAGVDWVSITSEPHACTLGVPFSVKDRYREENLYRVTGAIKPHCPWVRKRVAWVERGDTHVFC